MDNVERQQYTDLDCLKIENEAMYSEIKRLKAEIEDWKELVSGEAIRRADTQQKVDQLREGWCEAIELAESGTEMIRHRSEEIDRLIIDNAQLRAALQRIDGINDNPAVYNPMIEEVLRAVEPKL